MVPRSTSDKRSSRRLFLALCPGPEILAALIDLRRQLEASVPFSTQAADLRWLAEEAWHLTLFFLGEVGERAVSGLIASLEQQPIPRIRQPLDEILLLPSARNYRVIALGSRGTEAVFASFVESLGRRLEGLGFPLEARPFLPHVTLARTKSPLKATSVPHLPGAPLELEASGFTLFESLLGRGGAHYHAVASFPVG